ncbi:MAG: queuosine precursor transporter [Candidatus Thiodiazotropha sp. (ex Troendleina suluensis)]|nr:queuosine precursor transporter [Candidatus Thiodiazotropha sp. (ex Troendleina suluensis)]
MIAPNGYRLFHAIAILYVAVLIISNTIAVKIIEVGSFVLPAGIICFPVAYIINDVLAEVYGYQKTKSVVWWSFAALFLMSMLYFASVHLPSAGFWEHQDAYSQLFGLVPRIAAASFFAFLVGSFLNAYALSKMKIWSEGKHLWMRTIGSTVIGEGADSVIFNFTAFYGIFATQDLLLIALSGFVLKTLYEVLATPLTYYVINKVKSIEGIDTYDRGISYNPFKG